MSRLRLVLSESVRSLGANLSTTVAATMTVLIGMFLLGLFVALGSWVVSWSDHVKRELLVKVYFVKKDSNQQVNTVRERLIADPRIKSIKFVSAADALRIMEKRSPELTKDLPYNPLPDSFEITPRRAEDVRTLGPSLRADMRAGKLPGVNKVNDGKETSRRILKVARVIEATFLVAVIVLLIASVLLIANTIRLSIFSRRREIEVMKLVGATNWFVRGPFMLEGLICGFLGSIAAIVLLLVGKTVVVPSITGHIKSSSDVQALAFSLNALLLLVVGLAVGAVGSGMTLRRFLQV